MSGIRFLPGTIELFRISSMQFSLLIGTYYNSEPERKSHDKTCTSEVLCFKCHAIKIQPPQIGSDPGWN